MADTRLFRAFARNLTRVFAFFSATAGKAALTLIGQILIETIGGAVFKVEPLDVVNWLLIAGGTASVLVFAEVARLIRRKPAELPDKRRICFAHA